MTKPQSCQTSEVFLPTTASSLFRRLNRLPNQSESIVYSSIKMHVPSAFNRTNSQAALAQLFESSANHARLSAAPIHHPTYNNKYLDNPQEIAEAFVRSCAPSLTNDGNLPTSCLPGPTSESFSIVAFLSKRKLPC